MRPGREFLISALSPSSLMVCPLAMQVHLIRGNHEAHDINALFGFRLECLERLGDDQVGGVHAGEDGMRVGGGSSLSAASAWLVIGLQL